MSAPLGNTNRKTHGLSNDRLYHIWESMKQRCYNSKHKWFKCYGGAEPSIKVDIEWHEFIPFMKWSLEAGYEVELTLDRIDSTKDYGPGNCRWITATENFSKHR